MKNSYSFTTLRYIHDVMTGEFINVGVVLYSPKMNFLGGLFTTRYGRLSKTFMDINGDHFRQVIKYIEAKVEEEELRLKSELRFLTFKSVLDITSTILPKDNTSLQFSEEGFGVTEDLPKTLEHLFHRYVEKYQLKTEKISRNDEDVWRVYKKSLEEKRVIAFLKPHLISAANYEHDFQHCWKNEIWHLYEPISFDLLESTSIVDKANTWLGRITSLAENSERFKLNLLLGSPKDEKLKGSYIKAKNIMHKAACTHQFIEEHEAEKFAEELKKEIEGHEQTT